VNRRQLEGLARQTLRQLELRPPLDVDLLRVRLGERRGKPIDIVASTNLADYQTFGITGSKPSAECDVIMYEARTTWTHQIMIILHELAHMICQHPREAVDHSYRAEFAQQFQTISPQALAEVLGTRPPSPWRRTLRRRRAQPLFGRSLYDDAVEWEAETMATIMISWVPGCGAGHITPTPADPLEDILGDVPAW
jgi:hypothetical protein